MFIYIIPDYPLAFCVFLLFIDDLIFTYSLSECGGMLTNPTGVVTSPNFPNDYDHNDACAWTITAPEGTQIVVSIDLCPISMINILPSCAVAISTCISNTSSFYENTCLFNIFEEWKIKCLKRVTNGSDHIYNIVQFRYCIISSLIEMFDS